MKSRRDFIQPWLPALFLLAAMVGTIFSVDANEPTNQLMLGNEAMATKVINGKMSGDKLMVGLWADRDLASAITHLSGESLHIAALPDFCIFDVGGATSSWSNLRLDNHRWKFGNRLVSSNSAAVRDHSDRHSRTWQTQFCGASDPSDAE